MKKIAIVYSDYYPEITANLIGEFKQNFLNSNVSVDYLEYKVFGVAEIPYVVSKLSNDFDAVAVFGCVVEGKTYHHELINSYVFDKLYDLSINMDFILGYGILNVRNMTQAVERSQPNTEMNRGYEAFAAINQVLNLDVV